MKYCTSCGTALPDDRVKFCSSCGAAQTVFIEKDTSGNSAALVALCILTILGSVLGIIKGFLVQAVYSTASGGYYYGQHDSGPEVPFGYLSAAFNLGTLVGAILMLNRKKDGFVTYLVCQCANILIVCYWALFGAHTMRHYESGFTPYLLILASITVIPSIVFMVLYNMMVRKLLH